MDEDSLKDFPKLTDDELCDITLGVYQIKQAVIHKRAYVSKYEISIHKEHTGYRGTMNMIGYNEHS